MSNFTHPAPSDLYSLDNKGIHQFSLGVLDGYFNLDSLFKKFKVHKFKGALLIENIKPFMLIYSCEHTPSEISLITDIRKKATIYSLDKLSFLSSPRKVSECIYNLESVFDKENYQNAKKRHQRLVYPFKFLEKLQFSVEKITQENLSTIIQVHDKWVTQKLLDESVFKINFSKVRYKRCCTRVVEESILNYNYYGLALKLGNEIIGARVFALKDTSAYDLAYFVKFWDIPSQTSNYINVWVMEHLRSRGITHLNCGVYLHKKLSVFKSHLPHDSKFYYSYGKDKNEQSIGSSIRGSGFNDKPVLGFGL
jgi:hypothetical protein